MAPSKKSDKFSSSKDMRSSSGGRPKEKKAPGGAPRKYKKTKSEHKEKEQLDPIPGNKEWGGLARKGVLRVRHDDQRAEEERLHAPIEEIIEEVDPEIELLREERAKRKEERFQRQEELRAEARAALERANSRKKSKPKTDGSKPALKRKPLSNRRNTNNDLQAKLRKALGASDAKKAFKKLNEADSDFAQERFADAQRKINPLLKSAKNIAEIHELHGLIQYRLGKYDKAAFALEQFRTLANSTERHPILMDCYRSEQRWADIAYLWSELAEVSPSAAIVTEGRIVYSGAYADQGDLKNAVKMLEKGWKLPSRPKEHHLRRAYALADLYDRAGTAPKARELFRWIVQTTGTYVDAKERLKQLT
ncbi:MAG: hypothetical protein VX353_05185 [Actinomycetota bacterium]